MNEIPGFDLKGSHEICVMEHLRSINLSTPYENQKATALIIEGCRPVDPPLTNGDKAIGWIVLLLIIVFSLANRGKLTGADKTRQRDQDMMAAKGGQ